jgi:ATP-dependent DNA helicase RecQ
MANKKPVRYVEPLPPDFPGVRVDDAALKPREHAVPEATTGQNAFLKACREFLICDDDHPPNQSWHEQTGSNASC